MASAFFSDLLATISERGRLLLRRTDPTDQKPDADDLIELCEALLSGRGEASGTAMAREVLDHYQDLDADGQVAFFHALLRNFGPDRKKLEKAIEAWRAAFMPTPAVKTWPRITSLTSLGSSLARFKASWITAWPS